MLLGYSRRGVYVPRRKPLVRPRFIPEHPLALNLKAAVIYHNGNPYNYVTNMGASSVSATTPTASVDVNGSARSYVRASSTFDELPACGTAATDFFGCFAGVTLGTIVSPDNHTLFNANGSSTVAGQSVRLTAVSSSTFKLVSVTNGAVATDVTGNFSVVEGMYIGLAVQNASSNNFGFKNGVRSTLSNTTNINGVNGPLRIGGRSDNFFNGKIEFLYIWWGNRMSTMDDFLWLQSDPFTLFEDEGPIRTYSIASSPPPGGKKFLSIAGAGR